MVWYNKSQNSRQVYNSASNPYIMIRGITNFLEWYSTSDADLDVTEKPNS
jgi:hypothetical protein